MIEHQPAFPLHTETTAPADSQPYLRRAAENLGSIPNLERVMATSRPLLQAYVQLWELFDQTSFTPIERQVVYQTANYLNNCSYCVPWHTWLSKRADMPPAISDALRSGESLSDAKLESLRQFAAALIEFRGHPPQERLDDFMAAGYTSQQALEVVLGLGVKLLSNYTNGIAGTPLEPKMEPYSWQKPDSDQ